MKTITNKTITVKVQSTVAATIKLLKEAGAKIGKTSVADVLSGRKDSACGFFLAEEVVNPLSQMSKTEAAQLIFDDNFGTMSPKGIKGLLMSDAGLTKNGSSTYYYKMKSALKNV